jgi:hypothetical protein
MSGWRAWWRLAVIVPATLWLTWHVWGPSLGGGWAPWDDHEIVWFLGPDKALRWSEVLPDWVRSTEAGMPGQRDRYRPMYFLLRLVECAAWGENLAAWHLARLAMFAVGMGVSWILLTRVAGMALASAFVLYVATGRYWWEPFALLGPAESYVLTASALAALCAWWLWNGRAVRGWHATAAWTGLAASLVVALGCKENMLFLGLLAPVVLWRESRLGHATWAGWAATAAVLTWMGFMGWAVWASTRRKGTDMYGESVRLGDRFEVLLRHLSGQPALVWGTVVCGAALVVALAMWTKGPPRWRARARLALGCLSLILLLVGLAMSQMFLYGSGWSPLNRYGFPSQVLLALALLTAVVGLARMMPLPWQHAAVLCLGTAGFAAAAWYVGYGELRALGAANVARSRAFTGGLNRLVEAARRDPEAAVVLHSTTLSDFEVFGALRRFTRYESMTNPLVLPSPPEGLRQGHFPENVAAAARRFREDAAAGKHDYAPVEVLGRARRCVVMGINEEPPAGPCESLGKLFPEPSW